MGPFAGPAAARVPQTRIRPVQPWTAKRAAKKRPTAWDRVNEDDRIGDEE
jgi:hypothetical protein